MLRARDNPFSTDRVLRERYRFGGSDWERLLTRLAAQNGRGAVVGPKGTGKTTLLEDLATQLAATGRRVTLIRLSEEAAGLPDRFDRQFFRRLDHDDAVLLDGAEQLPLPRWLWFRWRSRRAGIVVITTHRAGCLPTLHRCTTSPALLGELVASLGQSLSPADAIALHRTHRGNLREALRELYDRHAHTGAVSLSFSQPQRVEDRPWIATRTHAS